MAFSENLQFLRTRSGQTQEGLAELLGVSRQSVSKWESAASFPEMDTLLRICDLYGVSLDVLLRGSAEDSLAEDTAGYDSFIDRFSWRIALSVGGIIAGVGLVPLLLLLGLSEMMLTALLLLCITVAVVVLVASGIQYGNFCKKHPVIQDFYTEEEKDAFHQRLVWYIAGGVGAILFGVVLMMLFFSVFPEEGPYEALAAALFLFTVAGAVVSFIYAGIQDDKYKVWKYNRDNNPTPEAKVRKGLIGALCGALMTLCTAVYVGLGLALGSWERDWWVFAVGGILCGAVVILLDPYKGED